MNSILSRETKDGLEGQMGVKGAEYYGPKGFMEMAGNPEKAASSKDSHNKEHAQKLWKISEKITGVSYI